MKRIILLFLVFLLSILVVGCKKKEVTNINSKVRTITLDNLNYSKEEFQKEYINYLFFVQQSLREISGGDNAVVVCHKTYKLNKDFTYDNLVSLETIEQAEKYLKNMKVNELKVLLEEYIEFVKELHKDFVYIANNTKITEDNVIETNKTIINKLEDKISELSNNEVNTVKPIFDYFVIEDISLKVDYSISENTEYTKENTLNKLKLVSNEVIAKQLLDSIFTK